MGRVFRRQKKEERNMSANNDMRMAKMNMQQKNVAVSLILTFLFGGLGLLYSSILWGVIAGVIEVILFASPFSRLDSGLSCGFPSAY